jgi:hypothetical protein
VIGHLFQDAAVFYFLIDSAALARGEIEAALPWFGDVL